MLHCTGTIARFAAMNQSAIVASFRRAAAEYCERVAVIGPQQSFTYRELERRVAAAASVIGEKVKGPTVALLYPNTPEFVVLHLGALWAGKTIAVLPTLAPPPLLKVMMMEVGAELAITSEEFAPRLIELGINCWIGEAGGELDPETVPQVPMAQEAAILLYTSGTTGRPKAVMLSEQNILDNALGCKEFMGFTNGDVMLAVLPMFHAYGQTVTMLLPLIVGATVVVPERFVPRHILQTIQEHKVTALVAVPGQYRVLVKDPMDADLSSLRLCISGAERLPDQVALEFRQRFGKEILQGYGATELSPVVSVNPPNDNHVGSAGKPLSNLKVTIRDENGNILPVGETGEVCVEGTAVMMGYYRDPEATARKIRNGVLHTSDKGHLDAEGFLHLSGRADDLVKVSGEKVYPSEVEMAIETIPGIDEAAVIAFPDEKHGSRLHAFVSRKTGAAIDESHLRLALREIVEHHKVPRVISFVDQLPRTITGKTDRRALATSV